MPTKTEIVDSSNFKDLLGGSKQADYLIRYLLKIGAQSCIVEREYTDKDYLLDYQLFYSRSFHGYPRLTTRYHFFGKKIGKKIFNEMLETSSQEELQSYLNPYLGFVITKPVEDKNGNTLIGRTLLKTYDERDEHGLRFFLKSKYTVSLFGIQLNIESIPFQMQDRRVSACSTIALWTTLHVLAKKFEIQHYSPGEVTEISTSHISQLRDFPQTGLSLHQIITCIKALSFDIEPFKINDEIVNKVPIIVRAYLTAGIPILATLSLKKNGKKVQHAAVITGFKSDFKGNITELYVHDDGIGPYSKVTPSEEHGFRFWINEWGDRGYELKLSELLVPIYQKIRLSFAKIDAASLARQGQIKKDFDSLKTKSSYEVRLCLCTIQEYKAKLLKNQIKNRNKILKTRMPRFLWVEHYFLNNEISYDYIYDATAVYPKLVVENPINYL